MRKFSILIILAMIIVSACSNTTEEGHSDDSISSVHDGSMGDFRQETSGKDVLPAFLEKHDENMQNLYIAVAGHKELLDHMPCYCGCGDIGHGHNGNCFIYGYKDDGAIVWDDHATRCQICLDIAAESIIEYNEGKTIEEIRKQIDEKYDGKGYPEPTDTLL